MKVLALFILLPTLALASDISDAFKNKDFNRVSDIYKANLRRNYNPKELIYISYSLRKLTFYRQDIKLNVRLIKTKYFEPHNRLIKAIKGNESIDSDEYPEPLKIIYYNLIRDYGAIVMGYNRKSVLIDKDLQHFNQFYKFTSALEFREGKVDKLSENVTLHLQSLENKIYKFSSSLSLQYITWQNYTAFVKTGERNDLVITNRGYCLGGDAGIENKNYHFFVDGCFLVASGNISAASGAAITYQQNNIPSYGFKIGPGASMIVSSTGSRIGVKLPIFYPQQKLAMPTGYTEEKKSDLSILTNLYSRWYFDKWFAQTEFGLFVGRRETFWGLGFGKTF